MTKIDNEMANKAAIPTEIQQQIKQAVDTYNKSNKTEYKVSFRGRYCYLSRMDNRSQKIIESSQLAQMLKLAGKTMPPPLPVETKIGRLEWTGDMSKWDFNVFLYSKERYDDDEALFFMPGKELLDGTIEGAMRAGHHIYP